MPPLVHKWLHRLGCALACLLTCLLLLLLGPSWFGPYNWTVIMGESVFPKFGLMRQITGLADLQTGDYVLVEWQGEDPNQVPQLKPGMYLAKKAACFPGQTLRVNKHFADCDGNYLGPVRKQSLSGQDLTPALFGGVIPKNKIFLLGDHPHSYDSRYFGLIDGSMVRGRLVFEVL